MASRQRSVLKVIILGDAGVGKTCLLNQYVKKQFSMQYKSTIGADFLTKELNLDGKVVQLQLWDTAGQEQFNSIGASFYRNAECCVLVCDLTDEKSFEGLEKWRTQFLNQLAPKDPDNFPFVVFGNKCDKSDERKVQDAKLKQYCESHNNIPYFETSAKTAVNVEKGFEEVAGLALKRNSKDDEIYIPPNPNTKLKLNSQGTTQTKNGCC